MSNNRDYATRDHAIRASLAEHKDLCVALQAAGVDATEASRIAFAEVKKTPHSIKVKRGRRMVKK